MNFGLRGFPGTSAPNSLVTSSDQRLPVIQGLAPVFGIRAWVNFNGSGTVAIKASGNVSSITDNGTGDYTINFTIPMQDANYAVSGAAGPVGNTSTRAVVSIWSSKTASALRIAVSEGTSTTAPSDDTDISVVIVR